jgi:hypothetical protein
MTLASAVSIMSAGLMLGCGDRPSSETTVASVHLYQNWQLQPGDAVQTYPVVSGLGDVSLDLDGQSVLAPFRGTVQQLDGSCAIFTSPDVPAYRFRLCGLSRLQLGEVNAGDRLGSAKILTLALLRRQTDGTWAMVEPSVTMLEQWLPPS